jgi:taurine dioxygenase
MSSTQDFEVLPFPAALGAEVIGVDLGLPLDDASFARIRRAWAEHLVLVFRDQRITPEAHVAFSRRLGPLQEHVLSQFLLEGHPGILIVSNELRDGKPIGLGDAGRYWHSDLAYKAVPSLGSALHAQTIPDGVGDTIFANMYAAYETLPPEVKRAVEGRQAANSYLKKYDELRSAGPWRPQLTAEQRAQVPETLHPVVRRHPDTGRKALFVSEGFTTRIEGVDAEESERLLAILFHNSVRPANTYRHRWRPHDLVLWDNRATMHLAVPCPLDRPRTLYRTTIEGEVPVGA